MANITTCTVCGSAYEESSEERAAERERLCGRCFEERCLNRLYNGTATPFERGVAERTRANHRCASTRCPGYSYRASDMAHPAETCV